MLPRYRLVTPVLLILGTACTAEVTLVPATAVSDSVPGDTTGNDTTIVQRATLTVTAQVAATDVAIASQLGWTGGVIAGAVIRARRGFQEHTETTDAGGQVTFADILGGTYQVSVLRTLSASERALLAPEFAELTAFGGGGNVLVAPPTTEATVAARSTQRGSLVISENFPSTWLGNDNYLFGTYVELYNNADTTIYLDGKLFGFGPIFRRDAPELGLPCSLTQQWQADPNGIWSPLLYRLPGSGRQYPMLPGEAAVLATDAVDHSLVDPRWPNLSNARFEFLGPTDVDNPAAANITPVATAFDDILGHGPRFDGSNIFFIANDLDVSTLPTVQPPNYRVPIPRVPRADVLDVVTFLNVQSYWDRNGWILCPLQIAEVFDTGPAFIMDAATFMSVVRRPIGSVLLRSRSTVNDFVIVGNPTPGSVP
jgi:hypothetical protein